MGPAESGETHLIIPAAGLGTRLAANLPKPLAPINGRAMLDYLFELYSPAVQRFFVVIHPSFEAAVRAHCALFPQAIEFAVQPAPTGMLDAILAPHDRIRTLSPSRVWITWCDQVAVHPGTVARLTNESAREPVAPLVFPTVHRAQPYTHLARDESGAIVDILHRREGDQLPDPGESEMGVFSLSHDAYVNLLPDFAQGVATGTLTRERNFLPFIPWLAARAPVRTFPCREEMEAVGINTQEDLVIIEEYLRQRRRQP